MPEIQGCLKRPHTCSSLEPAGRRWRSNVGRSAPSTSQPPPLLWLEQPRLRQAASRASGLRQDGELPGCKCHSPAACVKQGHIHRWAGCNTQQLRETTEMWMAFDKTASFVLIPNQSCLGLACLIFPSLPRPGSWYSPEGYLMLFVKRSVNTVEKYRGGKEGSPFLLLIFELACQAGNQDFSFGVAWQKRRIYEQNI